MANDSDTTDTNVDDSGNSKAKTFLQLAKLAQDSFQNRRAYEWKIAFGLWTGIALFTWFLAQHPALLSAAWLVVLGLLYLCVLAVYLLFWQIPLHRGFLLDKMWKHYYMHKAEGRSPEKSEPDPFDRAPTYGDRLKQMFTRSPENSVLWAWAWGQVFMTLIFLLVSFFILIVVNVQRERQAADDRISISGQISGENLHRLVDKLAK